MQFKSELRLCLALIIFSDPSLVALVATECSSFVHVNTSTSKRSAANPDGDSNMPSVRRGNSLAAVSCLFLLILTLLRRAYVLEQPGSSLLMKTCRMQLRRWPNLACAPTSNRSGCLHLDTPVQKGLVYGQTTGS